MLAFLFQGGRGRMTEMSTNRLESLSQMSGNARDECERSP
jgi:hypothetical protein